MKKFLLLLFFLLSISFSALGVIIRDSEIENFIKKIVTPIATAANQDAKKLKIILINDKNINAFVTPSQKIFLFTGLFFNSKKPNEIEGVLAHEIGHITGKHHVKMYEQIEKSRVINIAGLILGGAASILTGDSSALPAIAGGAQSTAQSVFLSFSRVQEGSADQAGFNFLKKSNKSLCGIVDFLELLGSLEQGYTINAYARSHPLTSQRISDAKNAARNEDCDKKRNWENLEEYKFIQAKLHGFIEPENTLKTFSTREDFNNDQKKYALAISNYKLSNLEKALDLINELIKKYPLNPYFYELKAQMLRDNGLLKEALENYIKVKKLLPNDSLILIELAQTLINFNSSKDNLNDAIKYLKIAGLNENDNHKLWYLLSVSHGRNGEMGKSRYASAFSAYLRGDDVLALSFIERAKKILKKGSVEWNKTVDLENKINLKKNKK